MAASVKFNTILCPRNNAQMSPKQHTYVYIGINQLKINIEQANALQFAEGKLKSLTAAKGDFFKKQNCCKRRLNYITQK